MNTIDLRHRFTNPPRVSIEQGASEQESPHMTTQAGALYCERRRRGQWFDADLFWDTAWDLLLYLYEAEENGQQSVARLSLRSLPISISPTSTERWLTLLEQRDYIMAAGRPGHVQLTVKARGAMSGFIASGSANPI